MKKIAEATAKQLVIMYASLGKSRVEAAMRKFGILPKALQDEFIRKHSIKGITQRISNDILSNCMELDPSLWVFIKSEISKEVTLIQRDKDTETAARIIFSPNGVYLQKNLKATRNKMTHSAEIMECLQLRHAIFPF